MSRARFSWTVDRNTAHLGDDWRERGLCRDDDPDKWFPIGTAGPAQRQAEEAKAICRRCPVRDACLDAGMDADYGIWGGYDEDERKALRRQQRAAV